MSALLIVHFSTRELTAAVVRRAWGAVMLRFARQPMPPREEAPVGRIVRPQLFRDVVRELKAYRLPVLVCVARASVLLLPSGPTEAAASEYLPPEFGSAFRATIPGRRGPVEVVLSLSAWKPYAACLADGGHRLAGAVFVAEAEADPSGALRSLAHAHGVASFDWLVPPPPPPWRRIGWSPRLERRLAAAGALLMAAGLFAGQAGTTIQGRLDRRAREARQAARRDGNRGEATDALRLVAAAVEALPRRAHLTELAFDGSLHRVRLRGRTEDFDAVSAYAAALAASPGVIRAHGEKSTLVKVGDRSVVEFSLEVIAR